MSKYREIQTEFRNGESLVKALTDLGVPHELAPNLKAPSLALMGYMDDKRPERASIAIRRQWINEHWSNTGSYHGISNDIGFAWNGSQYAAVVSDYDESRAGVQAGLAAIRQRYAFHEVSRLARAKGYNVNQSAGADGHIRLTLVRR